MRNFKIISLITFLLFVLTGCFQSKTLIKITPKGDGTIEETFLMKTEMIKSIQGMMQTDKNKANKEVALWTKKQFIDKALTMGNGVSVISFNLVKNTDAEGYNVIYKFTDINKLRINQNASENMPSSSNQKNDQNKPEYITFHFIKGNPSELLIFSPIKENAKNTQQNTNNVQSNNTGQTDKNALEMLKMMFKDLFVSIKVEIQGKIVQTDATYVTDSTITLMEMDYNKLLENPEKFKELSQQNPQTLEETKKIMADIPGIKVNLNQKTKVSFQ